MSGNRVVCVLPLSTILFDNACCKREREGPTWPRSAPRLSARLTTMAEMVWASSGVSRPEPTSSAVPAGDHLQRGGSPHDEVEPCDRKVGKEYKTEKPNWEGERSDDIYRGVF